MISSKDNSIFPKAQKFGNTLRAWHGCWTVSNAGKSQQI